MLLEPRSQMENPLRPSRLRRRHCLVTLTLQRVDVSHVVGDCFWAEPPCVGLLTAFEA
jgi:hypothetical protein